MKMFKGANQIYYDLSTENELLIIVDIVSWNVILTFVVIYNTVSFQFSFEYSFLGVSIALCLFLMLSDEINAQRDSKWAWSSKNRNDINEPHDRQSDRRKFESVEDFR